MNLTATGSDLGNKMFGTQPHSPLCSSQFLRNGIEMISVCVLINLRKSQFYCRSVIKSPVQTSPSQLFYVLSHEKYV